MSINVKLQSFHIFFQNLPSFLKQILNKYFPNNVRSSKIIRSPKNIRSLKNICSLKNIWSPNNIWSLKNTWSPKNIKPPKNVWSQKIRWNKISCKSFKRLSLSVRCDQVFPNHNCYYI